MEKNLIGTGAIGSRFTYNVEIYQIRACIEVTGLYRGCLSCEFFDNVEVCLRTACMARERADGTDVFFEKI